jgi:hypothetical protein
MGVQGTRTEVSASGLAEAAALAAVVRGEDDLCDVADGIVVRAQDVARPQFAHDRRPVLQKPARWFAGSGRRSLGGRLGSDDHRAQARKHDCLGACLEGGVGAQRALVSERAGH